ncbi:DUF4265 domain-containing protein [Lysobacter sp. Root494]|uniref:DUF4265 domain-containing protein n=1 Tax=Lysobacter sp. Root494 TaxID=1736549 RepID=UPI0012F881D5|nr:DUF4265 domain-containing protein [Lysobacter sp. Root494]
MLFSTQAEVKVTFPLEEDSWHGHATETLWAIPMGGHTYSLQNVPFFVVGVSRFDLVSAIKKDEQLVFQCLQGRSGHSTVRVVSAGGQKGFERLQTPITTLRDMGCEVERGNVADVCVYAVDVPTNVNFDAVIGLLDEMASRGGIDWEMGNDAHPD